MTRMLFEVKISPNVFGAKRHMCGHNALVINIDYFRRLRCVNDYSLMTLDSG